MKLTYKVFKVGNEYQGEVYCLDNCIHTVKGSLSYVRVQVVQFINQRKSLQARVAQKERSDYLSDGSPNG